MAQTKYDVQSLQKILLLLRRKALHGIMTFNYWCEYGDNSAKLLLSRKRSCQTYTIIEIKFRCSPHSRRCANDKLRRRCLYHRRHFQVLDDWHLKQKRQIVFVGQIKKKAVSWFYCHYKSQR